MSPWTEKDWRDATAHDGGGDTSTPISAAALEDLEERVKSPIDWYDVTLYGADPTGAGYSDTGFEAALDAIRALDTTTPVAPDNHSKGAVLFIPWGKYKLANTLEIDRGIVVQGVSGAGWYAGSKLIFDDGVTGIVIQRFDTSADGGRGDWSVIRDIHLQAAGKTVAGADGIRLIARAKVENVYINNFSRDGINIDTEESGKNANLWRVDYCRCDENGRHGLLVRGSDSNAGIATGVDCSSNLGWGIYDSSFLGNAYIGCHTASNGYYGTTTTLSGGIDDTVATITLASSADANVDGGVVVIDSEHIKYAAVSGSDLTGCTRGHAGTTPASHSNGATVTYAYGGFRTDGATNTSTFVGCYTEAGQGTGNTVDVPSSVFGGIGGRDGGETAPKYAERLGDAFINIALSIPTGTGAAPNTDYIRLGGGGTVKNQISMGNVTDGVYNVRWDSTRLKFMHDGSGAREAIVFTGDADASSLPAGQVLFQNGLYLSEGGHKKVTNGGAAPASGTHVAGEIVFNTAPTAGGYVGWVCTSGGTPGTWKTFGAISA